jgi:uncharacterized C2H2 Zn-finger protein
MSHDPQPKTKKFPCPYCSTEYPSENNYLRHFKKTHGVSQTKEQKIIHEIADLEEKIRQKNNEIRDINNAIIDLRNSLFVLKFNRGKRYL